MILRKPYAFFIKHFKLMHLILAVLMCYSIYKTKELLDFFNEYSSIIINVKGQDLVTPLLPFLFQIVPILIIIIATTIMVVLIVKKKPYLFYIILITIFIFSMVLLQFSKFTLISLSNNIIDSRTILLLRDLIMICFIIQLVEVVIVFVRATGFDVRKFDFDTDLKKIKITEEDREEVEVEINFDGNKFIRNIRRYIRFLKYTYKENKKIANIIISTFCVIILFTIIFSNVNKNVIIEQKVYFNGNYFSFSILDSYIVNTDYKGKNLTDDYYLILRINIKNNTNQALKLDIATTKILIDNYVYTPTTEYKDSFSDFGYVYQGEEINQEYEEKLLVYSIPKELIKKDIFFSFVDKNNIDEEGNFKTTKIKINYQDLIGISTSNTTSLSKELLINDSILPNTSIFINAFDIQDRFKINYQFCINSECFNSYEYLYPAVNSNYDKVLLKMNGTIKSEKNMNGIYDLYDFIEKFGQLIYVVNGEKKIQSIEFKEVKSKKTNQNDVYYIEVLKEVKEANNISILFTVRNKSYEYVLK